MIITDEIKAIFDKYLNDSAITKQSVRISPNGKEDFTPNAFDISDVDFNMEL